MTFDFWSIFKIRGREIWVQGCPTTTPTRWLPRTIPQSAYTTRGGGREKKCNPGNRRLLIIIIIYSQSPVISIYKFKGRPEMLSNFRKVRPEMLKLNMLSKIIQYYRTMYLHRRFIKRFYVFTQRSRRTSISQIFNRPDMLSNFKKVRPEMLITVDAYHWGLTVRD